MSSQRRFGGRTQATHASGMQRRMKRVGPAWAGIAAALVAAVPSGVPRAPLWRQRGRLPSPCGQTPCLQGHKSGTQARRRGWTRSSGKYPLVCSLKGA
jgi:hypothetical protein